MSTQIKTKEEILKEHYPDFDIKSGWMFDGSVQDVLSAMDEYTKQQVVEFDEWKQKNKYQQSENGWYSNQPPIAGKQTWFSTEELYSIFLKEISK